VISYLEFEDRSDATKAYVEKLLGHFRNTAPDEIDQPAVDAACRKLLSAGAKAATKIRAVYTPLGAILKHGAIRKMCAAPMFQKPSVKQTRKVFLLPAEVNALIEAAAPHLRPLFTFLAGTGVRMSEALELQWADVDLRGARAVVRQKQGDFRYLDMPPRVIAALAALPPAPGTSERAGAVFRTPAKLDGQGAIKQLGAPYGNTRVCGGQIKTGWATACRKAGLAGAWREWQTKDGRAMRAFCPDATPHSLRHSFASWHYCVHRDLIRLKDDGGWSTITMVAGYAKKMPDAYRDEVIAWWAGGPALMSRKEA
jgi:integrase